MIEQKWIYKEVPADFTKEFIDILNYHGQYGWEFLMQVQKQIPQTVHISRQPVIKNTLLFKKREFSLDHVMLEKFLKKYKVISKEPYIPGKDVYL